MPATTWVNKGKTYVIRSFRDRDVALRMLSMGIQPGQEFRILHRSPFGKCYFLAIGNRWVAARAEELDAIEWVESETAD